MKNKYDLSVLIPARNEEYLLLTVNNILKNKRGKTEIIVGLDGQWSDTPLPDHPDLTIFYVPESLGQRAITNQCARLSTAKYVMKLDAHCAVDEGFDVKILEDIQEDWTMIPTLYNLHMFDWVCETCKHRLYQCPTPAKCPECAGKMKKEIIFKPRLNRKSTHYRFDKTMHFQYWGALGKREGYEGDISDTLSAQGSCFILSREKYWELDICDEKHGSWGQQGTEVALKTWLSGGRLVITRKTWYSHMFRTQGGDFGFPYPLSGNEQEKARIYSRDLWLNDKWPKAKYKLQWLLDKFSPIPDWHDEDGIVNKENTIVNPIVNKNIIFYTDNQLKLKYAHAVQKKLQETGIPIISASLKPMPHFGTNVHIPMERGLEAYFNQIISALEKSTADIVYMCEHDVIYHPSHFNFVPPRKDMFYYNQNFWRIRPEVDNFAVHWNANQVSGLVCYREYLLYWYKKKWDFIQKFGFDRSYEPGGRYKDQYVVFQSEYPNIDIRHGNNLTKSKWSLADFRDKSTSEGWQESTIEQIKGWDIDFLQSLR